MDRPKEEQLAAALADALEGLREMLPYVPEYFVEKWQLQGYVDRAEQFLTTMSYTPVNDADEILTTFEDAKAALREALVAHQLQLRRIDHLGDLAVYLAGEPRD